MPRYDTVKETVPRFKKRPGDAVLAGSNNATLVLGSDAVHADETGAGAACLVVGRKGETLDRDADVSFIYLSMRGDTDGASAQPIAVVKSDHVRIIARKTLAVQVGSATLTMHQDGSIVIDGDIKLGSDATQRVLRGDAFVQVYAQHTHVATSLGSPTSPPVVPVPPTVFSSKARVD